MITVRWLPKSKRICCLYNDLATAQGKDLRPSFKKRVSLFASVLPVDFAHLAGRAAFAFVVLFLVERKLFDLAAIMFRIDLFAFGGGFASAPLMYHEIVAEKPGRWVPSGIDGDRFRSAHPVNVTMRDGK